MIYDLAPTMAMAERWICAMAPQSGLGRAERLSEGTDWGSDAPEENRALRAADTLVLPPPVLKDRKRIERALRRTGRLRFLKEGRRPAERN